MKTVTGKQIAATVEQLCLKANFHLRSDVVRALKKNMGKEKSARARNFLKILLENARIARRKNLAICQDTGMVVVFVEIGQDIRIRGNIEEAVNRGVSRAYRKGYLRKSIVSDPLIRENTGDNTPAVIHSRIVPGRKLRISVLLKGFGSENKSRLFMLNPTAGADEIKRKIVQAVWDAGAEACPPFVLGIGIGGTCDVACMLAKEALLNPVGKPSRKKHIAKLEKEILKSVNRLNIGPFGLGGKTTALGVSILDYPTHIAGLPVAVNINCHALRSKVGTVTYLI